MMQEKDAEIAELRAVVGLGSASTNNEPLGFVWLVTWVLLGGVILVGLFIGLRLRRVGNV